MARKSIREMRRRELVEAIRDVIAESGFESATISKISKRAGFSIGYLHHHFSGKDALLAESIRVLYGDMRTYLAQAMPGVEDPIDRHLIVLNANFRKEQYTKENAYAWISFLARVPFNLDFIRLQRMIEHRLYSNLMFNLKELLPPDEAQAAAEEISTLIDGYWVRLGVSPDSINSEKALEFMWTVSDRFLTGRIRKRLKSFKPVAG